MLVEDVSRAQDCYHAEEGKLVFVDQGRGKEGSRQEMKGWGRRTGVEALEYLQGQPPLNGSTFISAQKY